ncbi:NADP-binding protein [Dacryopinax primogenitus]|uniref:NADP-binding protein n=1 Tax=Dacryopinax primogenitus (strain DJM 731) TaxID=1858805 RepID=M5GB19_DACPD|nr:NADP-binding protein [Dacryopinax primogenitus]EJU03182.1 NADP-binding protein [Dacryopinax primogenitus]
MTQGLKEPKVWLITGALTGFGRLMTQLVLSHGDSCVATSLDPSALQDLSTQYGTKLLNLHLDVTDASGIKSVFSAAKAHFGRLDVVYNNAGLGFYGVVESVPEEAARKLFDVNFWAVVAVSKEAVRFFRDENPTKGGKLFIMSSTVGLWPISQIGHYAATKHAVEAVTLSMMRELKPEWNIQTTLVEPGWFLTPILGKSSGRWYDCPELYGGDERTGLRIKGIGKPGDPEKAVELIYSVAQREKLPEHLPIGELVIKSLRSLAKRWTAVADEWEVEGGKTEFGEGTPLDVLD